ncbi:uncharacterized protein TNCV_831681 [Trichonephila clavipes]|nr:uncharacterized protein TNCV_831681 [Trichonephila clavipes]
MGSHTLTPAVWGVCRCKAKAELRRSPRDFQIRKRLSSLLKLNLDSSLKTWFHSVAVQSRRARHYSKRRILRVGVIGSILKGPCDTTCPSARRLATVREDTGARSKGASCVWTATNDAVVSMCVCRIRRSSR